MSSQGDECETTSHGLEAVIQKLEASLRHGDQSSVEGRSQILTPRGHGHDSSVTCHTTPPTLPGPASPVLSRVRQIITKNLAEQPTDGDDGVVEQNRLLKEQLSQARLDQDQLLIKQNQLTDRLEQMLALHSAAGDPDQESVSAEHLQLRSEQKAYRLKLQAYHEAQHRQTQLVQKLQAKVLQYKKRCGELEEQVLDKTSETEKLRLSLQAHLDSSAHCLQLQENSVPIQNRLALLEEEQKRCAALSQVNALLREQLEQAGLANQGLKESLHQTREDLQQKDARLRKEQETCASRLGREQARVRVLWRQAASLRSSFTQLRSFTDRSLSDMRGECVTLSHCLHLACMSLETSVSPYSTPSGLEVSELERKLRDTLRDTMQLQGRWDTEKVELNSRVLEMADMVKHLREQMKEKDSALTAMQTGLDRMEASRVEDKAQIDDLLLEVDHLQQILTSITQLVSGNESSSSGLPHSSPSALRGGSSQGHSTLLAVQHLLSQHHILTQELRGHLEVAQEQVDTLRSRLQEAEVERRGLEGRMQEVQRENLLGGRNLEESLRDVQRCRNSLEVITSEKASLEKLILVLQQEAKSRGSEMEVMRGSVGDLQRERDLLRQQRDDLERQLGRQNTDAQRCERSLEQMEVKHSDLRHELVSVREALSHVTLQKEVLEDDKASLTLALNKMESQMSEQELCLTKLQSQEAGLRDSLAKMADLSEGLANDKVELNRILLKIEGEKVELAERRREADAERSAAREDIGRLMQEVREQTAAKRALETSHDLLQETVHRLEAQLGLLQRNNSQVLEQHAQVTKQFQNQSDQLVAVRKELDCQAVSLQRAQMAWEELARDKASLEVQLTTADRKAWGLAEELADLRVEKESLEANVFEGQELASSLEGEMSRLEVERQGLKLANEALAREVACLKAEVELRVSQAGQERQVLEAKLAQAERTHLMELSTREHCHSEQLEALRNEKEQQYVDLTQQRERTEAQLRSDCEEQRLVIQAELQQLQEDMVKLQQEHNRTLLHMESTKQQALSQKDTEKAALTERLAGLQQDLEAAGVEMDRVRRQALSHQQQDKDTISGLERELQALRCHFEESVSCHESSEKKLLEDIRELNQLKENARTQLEGLQRDLQEAEDGRDAGRRELIEAHREVREVAQERDDQRKEVLDLRRLLGYEARDKEAIQTSNQELRAAVKRAENDNNSLRRNLEEREQKVGILEGCKASLQREVSKLRSTMRDLEKSRLQARREMQELRRQVKILEGEASNRKAELSELQARVCQEEMKEEEARRETFGLKQRVLESEAGREVAMNEASGLQRHLSELEETELQMKEVLAERQAELQKSLFLHREETSKLQGALEEQASQVREVTLRVTLAEGRAQGLEEQLALGNAVKRELEHKLATLTSALRRTLGSRGRSPSPWRSHSPQKGSGSIPDGTTRISGGRGSSPSRGECGELEVDAVQTALRDFHQGFKDALRDRDEAQAQVVSLNRQVAELETQQNQSRIKLHQLTQAMKDLEQGKREMSEQLHQAQTSLSLQEEVTSRGDRDRKSLVEEVSRLKSSLQTAEADCRVLQDKLDRSQAGQARCLGECQRLKEALKTAESRASGLELTQRTLEGELQRSQRRAVELDGEVTVLGDRLVEQRRKLQDSEDQAAGLRVDQERLATALTHAETQEFRLKEQLQGLSSSLSDSSERTAALQEQSAQLQKALSISDQDRKTMQERLDKLRETLCDSKRQNHSLTQRLQKVQRAQDHAALQASELEKQNWTLMEALKQKQEAAAMAMQESNTQQRDELQERLTGLHSTLKKMEGERAELDRAVTRLGKDKAALRKTLEKVELERIRREEEAVISEREKEQLGHTVHTLQQDINQQQLQMQTLQTQMSQLERAHAQRFLEVSSHHRQEMELVTERLRATQLEAERALEVREKAHRQRVLVLEEQVLTLKEQLDQEMRRRQAYVSQILR
ncbi:hypothetical protein UPYG_G00039950 [Umbra pygmaea]|uniref:Rootletin-like coiled-coil domain-containing protein n=1 Tax=Umbra pygmaea TaxID=75934 RepID=A0ABD0YBP2_UMBPY